MRTEREQQLLGGRYLLERRACRFGHVELYSALDRQLERPVSVQVVAADSSPAFRAAFVRRQAAVAGINHCGVAEVYDRGEWNGLPYTVMESGALPGPSAFPASARHGDVEDALRVTRQVAEGLQCLRDGGMAGWVFSYDAVRRAANGDAYLAVLEGLGDAALPGARYASAREEDDPGALGALLRLCLLGDPRTGESRDRIAALPPAAADLLSRLEGRGQAFACAGEVAAAIASLETAAQQPTEAHPATPLAAVAPVAAGIVLQSAPAQSEQQAVSDPKPYLPPPAPEGASAREATAPLSRPQRWGGSFRAGGAVAPLAIAGLSILALLGLIFMLRPRTEQAAASVAVTPVAATPVVSSSTPPTALVAPDLRGKPLAEAQQQAEGLALALATAEPVNSDTYRAGVVAAQAPEPGSPIDAATALTVSLSLGPAQSAAPAPTEPPAPPQVEQSQQPPPAQGGNEKKAEKKKEDKKGGPKKNK